MLKKLADLTIIKSSDWKNTVVKALQEAGFTVVLEYDGISEDKYIIAEGDKDADSN